MQHVDDRLDDGDAPGHRSHPLEIPERVGGVVQHTEEQDHVERTDRVGRQGFDLDHPILDLEAEDPARGLEVLAGGIVGPLPHEAVGGQDPLGAATLGLEAERALVGADVEHRLAGEVGGQLHVRGLVDRAVVAVGHEAVAQVDGVEPAAIRDLGSQGFDGLVGDVHQITSSRRS